MDIAGTKKKIQRLSKVVEESYKKINELMERIQKLQQDLEVTSEQVDEIEYDLAEQRVLLEGLAEAQGLDVAELLEDADLPERPGEDEEDAEEAEEDLSKKATSQPSAAEED